jgi:hypothetical protein
MWWKYCEYMYENGKMRPVELFQEWDVGRKLRRMMEGVNSTLAYSKDFCKCHNIPTIQQ